MSAWPIGAAFVADLQTLSRVDISSEWLRQLGDMLNEPASGNSVGVGVRIDSALWLFERRAFD